MKFKTTKTTLSLFACLLFVSSTIAAPMIDDDKITSKTRAAVENASPDDWFTLAKSAKLCLDKKVNLKEASAWLDQSLQIAEKPFNLEVKGDYYMMNQLPEKALPYYIKAVQLSSEDDAFDENIEAIQKKISDIVEIGG